MKARHKKRRLYRISYRYIDVFGQRITRDQVLIQDPRIVKVLTELLEAEDREFIQQLREVGKN